MRDDLIRIESIGYTFHPEVWLLVLGVGLGYWYALTRIGPRATPGGPVASRANIVWFTAGLVTLWVASDWPVHDVAEEHLYFVHMIQHTLLSFVMPAMFLLAVPEWLARLVIGGPGSRSYAAARWLTMPVVAAVLFNAVQLGTHWPLVVNESVSNGLLHYGLHTLAVATALVMWMPVCGPIPEFRISRPAQMVYLFVMSVGPTVPAGWLTFAEGAVYRAYDTPQRLFGISVTDDQQFAGLVMKLGAGMLLWSIIAVLFFRWAAGDMSPSSPSAGSRKPEPPGPPGTLDPEPLTFEDVTREFDRVPAPQIE